MIAFDNGPADGDYVRYIEAMAKVAATNAVQAAATPMASSASAATGFDDPMQARMRQVAIQRSTTTPTATTKAAALQVMSAGAVLPALGRGLVSMLAGIVVGIVGVSMRHTSVLAVLAGIALFIVGFRQTTNAMVAIREAARNRAATT